MKGLKKILALVLCGIIVFACTACSDGGGLGSGTKVDNSKRTVVKLYVSGGGYGSKPYEEQAARFREATSEKIYEPGTDKKGAAVEVVVADSAESIKLDAGLLNQGYHIVGGSSYEKSIDAVVGDQLATNIDAIMRTTIPGENKTIIDKIPESQRWMYSVKSSTTTNEDGRVYYGFPGVQAYGGLTYDKDLFDEKLCYIAKPDATEGIQTYNCTIIRQQVKFTNVAASKSVGPDGIANTEDDGMPSSLYELIALCDKLKVRDKIAPFMLLGDTRFTFYNNYFADALYASLLGAENALAINNFKSDEMEVVVGFTNEPLFPGDTASGLKKPITAKVKVDESCGYYVTHTVEKYYTYAFFKLMQDREWYKDGMGSSSHTATQLSFIRGKKVPTERAGMLIECSYWYNESNKVGNFSTYETLYPNDKRELRWMSLPVNIETSVNGVAANVATSFNSTESSKGENMVLSESGSGYVCINARYANDTAVMEVIKDYLLFIFSDAELSKFSVAGCYMRGVDYDVNPDDYANATSFVKSYMKLTANASVAYASGDSDIARLADQGHRFLRSGNSGFFATGAALATPIQDSIKAYGPLKCFKDKIITKDGWKTYFSTADEMPSANLYPTGHDKAGQEIKFEG